jgi:predicted transcriptional regulator of viral defense system
MTEQERISRLLRSGGVSARRATAAGIHRQTLTRLVADGTLERVARGQYRRAGAPITEHHTLAVVAASIPRGVVCLLSALAFHGVGTQLPWQVWLAIDRRARKPARALPIRIFRFGGAALTAGVETHRLEGERVRIYSVAKTIVDCFKYRNKIGLDVALEALRDGWHTRRFTMDELERHARVCRMSRVLRPYVELLIA